MKTEDANDGRSPAPTTDEGRRKPYATPTLTAYGPVESVTGNLGPKGSDGLAGSNLL